MVQDKIDTKIALAIAIVESGLGKANNGHNLFGISSNEVGVSFSSFDESINNLISGNNIIANHNGKVTSINQIRAWNSINPNYWSKIQSIINSMS